MSEAAIDRYLEFLFIIQHDNQIKTYLHLELPIKGTCLFPQIKSKEYANIVDSVEGGSTDRG